VPHDSPETWALESEADARGQGEAFFTKLPTDFAPVQVSDAELSAAMATLWLDIPLRVAASRPSMGSIASGEDGPGFQDDDKSVLR
jgi:hypothetical protein